VRTLLGVLFLVLVAALVASSFFGDSAGKRQPVIVGGYQFEPFVGPQDGVSRDFVGLLNNVQDRYDFTFREITAPERYGAMARAQIDMILFEEAVWGWDDQPVQVDVTVPILSGAEVLVGRAGEFRGNLLYSALKTRRLALTIGYHYGFADFNADQAYLRTNFNVVFAEHQRDTLNLLLAGEADIAVLNEAFLERAYTADPSLRAALVQADRHDQDYSLPIMVRRDGPVTAAELNGILTEMRRTGQLTTFFNFKGLGRFVLPAE